MPTQPALAPAAPIRLLACLVSLLVLSFAPADAIAHGRSVSYSTWRLDGQSVHISVRVADLDLSAVDAARLASVSASGANGGAHAGPGTHAELTFDELLAAYVSQSVTALEGSTPCAEVADTRTTATQGGWRTVSWTLRCAGAGADALHVDLLFDSLPAHLHFARVDGKAATSVERLLTSERRGWVLGENVAAKSPAEVSGSSFGVYVSLGVEHILSGYDHVAFLVALLLLARTLGEVALLASSFTLAHSITLALAALGIVTPVAFAIEALIGFSIALVAIENAWLLAGRPSFVPAALGIMLMGMSVAAGMGIVSLSPVVLAGLAVFCVSHFLLMARVRDGTRLRAIVAFCFGLAHGFGFAGVLSEIAADPSRLVRGLLGFNVGVELGQLAIVAFVWPFLVLAQRAWGERPRLLIAEIGSAVVCALGTFWFLVRSLG